jgi:hypothetical protein
VEGSKKKEQKKQAGKKKGNSGKRNKNTPADEPDRSSTDEEPEQGGRLGA